MSFFTDVIKQDPRYTSTERINDLALLEPVTRAAVQAIVAAAEAQGHHLEVLETFRSQARQQMLYAQHATQLRQVGTHGYGLAADFLLLAPDGTADWAGGDYSILKGLAEAHGLLWGGDWGDSAMPHSFRDLDHVQRINVTDQLRLFAGTWYPDDGYAPVIK